MISDLRVSGTPFIGRNALKTRSRCQSESFPAVIFYAFALLMSTSSAAAQLITFPKQELVDYTGKNPFERLPDGQPKVPEDLIERARELSSEEVWAVLEDKGFN